MDKTMEKEDFRAYQSFYKTAFRRLSNFLPWQTTYAELYFTDVLWPDFSEADLQEALAYYRTIQINKGR